MQVSAKTLIFASALTGTALCVANFLGADIFCFTKGCEVYTWGKGFYLLGAVGFAGILVLVMGRERFGAGRLLMLALGTGLIIDTLLLGYQFLLWPCSSCLAVALLFGLTTAAALFAYRDLRRGWIFATAGLWTVCFFAVGLATAKDLLFQPWNIAGNGQAEIRVFFSPSCNSCEQVVSQLVDTVGDLNQVGFYPVAKNSEDVVRIARILPEVEDPVLRGQALKSLFVSAVGQGSEPETAMGLRERFGLWSNKVALARTGRTTVPEIVAPKVLVAYRNNQSDWNAMSLPGGFSEAFFLGSDGDASCSAYETATACE
jgi:hypothetical protein